ncbi:hypothetical protein [Lacipirellula parvula]|uniref:Uncharacterized protein n=1 Tax=Lacipirellula parvula TaxID=2650471 RepID=A0A5K7XCY7_9BACT|nr:hypothetical protein [Lacipirellula parvula]BBO34328.1 hypothetical protein PLANPX_3940 [Lacipirellula parvula]
MATQLHLSLTPDAEARLIAKAKACGEEPERHAEKLLSSALMSTSLDEVLASFRQAVSDSGMSDDELDSFYEGLRDKVWQESHPKKSA